MRLPGWTDMLLWTLFDDALDVQTDTGWLLLYRGDGRVRVTRADGAKVWRAVQRRP